MKKFFVACLLLLASSQVFAAKAPNFTLETQDGRSVSLSDYQGKPIVLHFWATWCPYCKKLQPGLVKLHKKYQDQGLELLAISLREDEGAKPQDELKSRGYDFLTLVEGEKVAEQYYVQGTPTTFFIAKDGEVLWVTNQSDPNNPKLEKAVQAIIASNK